MSSTAPSRAAIQGQLCRVLEVWGWAELWWGGNRGWVCTKPVLCYLLPTSGRAPTAGGLAVCPPQHAEKGLPAGHRGPPASAPGANIQPASHRQSATAAQGTACSSPDAIMHGLKLLPLLPSPLALPLMGTAYLYYTFPEFSWNCSPSTGKGRHLDSYLAP